jgi:uncharacterized protein (DUF58 family)
MRVRPGRHLVWAIGGLAAWSLLGLVEFLFVLPIPIVLGILLILAALEWRQLRQTLSGITITRSLPKTVGRDMPLIVGLRCRNASQRPLIGEFRDVVPSTCVPSRWAAPLSIVQDSETELKQIFRIPIRGKFSFGPVWLRAFGNLGLVEVQKPFDALGEISVLPEGLVSESQLAQETAEEIRLLDKLLHSRQRGAGTEFAGLNEYRDGDDVRRIDWRATARLRRPIVRQFQIERHRDVMIIVDCGRLMGSETPKGTKLDCAIDAGLMLARVALHSGDRCGMAVFSDRVHGYLRPIAGMPAMRAMVESLYDLQPNYRESDFGQVFAALQARQSKRALVVVISDVVDAETSPRFRESLAALSRRHILLFAALQTPLLETIIRAPVQSFINAAQKAVVFRSQRERERALHSIRRSGVHVLDVTPSELTVPLINQFIELRGANLL